MLLPVLHPAFSPFFLKFKKLIVKLLHVAGTKLLGNGEQEWQWLASHHAHLTAMSSAE
jgi:hypothetical protein